MCRIGRTLGFGQVNLADKAVINLNVLPAGAVLIINLPIEKYLEDLKKRFYDSNIETYQISSELSIDEQYEEYIELLKEDLAIKEDFQILEKRGQE